MGFRYEPPPEHAHDVDSHNLLTETDLDPSLIRKWGWGLTPRADPLRR
jgi:hypothetical protein